MMSLYTQCQYNPIINEWPAVIPLTPIHTIQPVIIQPNISSYVCPYVTPIHTQIIQSPAILSCDISPNWDTNNLEPQQNTEEKNDEGLVEDRDPIEYYLTLPKDLFPSPRMLDLDPNVMIEEFCKMQEVSKHVPWILDLEFGIPQRLDDKKPIRRHIPVYDVKFNSIHCRNTPGAIHPGFESCDEGFKAALLFYYDCIVSAWYRGYMISNCDKSVDKFQSWLQLPMEMFGVNWSS